MKNIFAVVLVYMHVCMYICGIIIDLLHVYLLSIYVCVFILLVQRTVSLYVCFVTRINAVSVYSSSDRSHL